MSIDKFLKDVQKEAEKAVKEHGEFNSVHEFWGIFAEECAEAFEHVREKNKNRNNKEFYKELVQCAAACLKMATRL